MKENAKITLSYKGNNFKFEAQTKEKLLLQFKEIMPLMIESVIELMTLDEQRDLLIQKLHEKSRDADALTDVEGGQDERN